MNYSVALVGAGPTAIYCLQALLAGESPPASITIFERQRRAGQGTPYSANWSDPIMLANIASIEIPSLPCTLVHWLRSEPDERLKFFGISRADIDERAFYPRLVVGEYLASQFSVLVDQARSAGIEVDVRTQTMVTDVRIAGDKIRLTVTGSHQEQSSFLFDYAILATGHQWPSDPEVSPGYFTSPWPASALDRIHNCPVGIRGTSLTAIDACVALANQHGAFVRSQQNQLTYVAGPGTHNFSVTMFSRKGILPEADFFHPIPYEPLAICTAEAMQALIAESKNDHLLDASFELFRHELLQDDPDYAADIGLRTKSLEEFSAVYFAGREHADPFDWARRNLRESVDNGERKFTVPWRYAILRMHEVFGILVPHLNDADFARFSDIFKPVFVDNYATVPHESIERLLALREAGKVAIESLDAGFRLRVHPPGVTLRHDGRVMDFPAFIEAIGQRMLSAKDFPFPSLRRQGVVQDLESDQGNDAKRGIAIDGAFHPISAFEQSERLFCLSLPFLLGQHPFAQGITSSAEMASVVADAIQTAERLLPDGIGNGAPSGTHPGA